MITNNGKNIIAKYLLGQVPAYASYIAVGCGPKPLATADSFGDYSSKTKLDFELFRVPIISRGFVNEGGVSSVVFTAEMPSEERYEISEIGVFSAKSDPLVGINTSRVLFKVTSNEGWVQSNGNPVSPVIDTGITGFVDNVTANNKAFWGNATDEFFGSQPTNKYETPRFLNESLMARGDYSTIDAEPSSSPYIKLTGLNIDLSTASPSDTIAIAFSVINKVADSSADPGTATIKLRLKTDSAKYAYANFQVATTNNANRYYVIEVPLSAFTLVGSFNWTNIVEANLLVNVAGGTGSSSDYYIAVDGIRYENKSSDNPLYCLTGYSVIKNTDALTIVKKENTSGYVEFRFNVGVV
jgi:hypothetical protein